MPEKIKDVKKPRGLSRLAWRSGILVYRVGLGRLFGERLLLLNHMGRKSGKIRQTVLEVVSRDEKTGAYLVASGFGEKSDWYKNVMAHPAITIQVGNRRMEAQAERLPYDKACEVLLDYNHRHPATLKTLAEILGYRTDGRESDMRYFAEVIPILAFTPVKKEHG